MYHRAGEQASYIQTSQTVMVKATPVEVFTVSRLDGKVKPSVDCYVDIGGKA